MGCPAPGISGRCGSLKDGLARFAEDPRYMADADSEEIGHSFCRETSIIIVELFCSVNRSQRINGTVENSDGGWS